MVWFSKHCPACKAISNTVRVIWTTNKVYCINFLFFFSIVSLFFIPLPTLMALFWGGGVHRWTYLHRWTFFKRCNLPKPRAARQAPPKEAMWHSPISGLLGVLGRLITDYDRLWFLRFRSCRPLLGDKRTCLLWGLPLLLLCHLSICTPRPQSSLYRMALVL